MINLNNIIPTNMSAGVFINEQIKITLDQQVDSLFFNTQYFMLYKSNKDYNQYHHLVNLSISQKEISEGDEEFIVLLEPDPDFEKNSNYILIVLGGTHGIRSISDDYLAESIIYKFETGSSKRISSDVTATIDSINLFLDGSSGNSQLNQSYDIFALSGKNAVIYPTMVIPGEYSIFVKNFSSIIIQFNDDIANIALPVNILNGRVKSLPYEINIGTNNSIIPESLEIEGNIITFNLPREYNEDNKEYIFTLSPGIIKGKNKQSSYNESFTFRFISNLTPLYADPDQIISKMMGFIGEEIPNVTTYEIFKLIFDKSLYFISKYNILLTPENIHIINRLIVCLVSLDLLVSESITKRRVKSRALIATRVEYFDSKMSELIGPLEDCIEESLIDLGLTNSINIGIKSGNKLMRNTKIYGVYR